MDALLLFNTYMILYKKQGCFLLLVYTFMLLLFHTNAFYQLIKNRRHKNLHTLTRLHNNTFTRLCFVQRNTK